MTAEVFVAIPSYADPDIVETVRSALSTAERTVRVGVVLQDDDPALEPALQALGADVHAMRLDQARGLGWARAIAASLWQGEPWYYQCDAHMRFEEGWDSDFIARVEALPRPGVLSAHPLGLTQDLPGHTTASQVYGVLDHGVRTSGIAVPEWGEQPVPARVLSGANQFMPAEAILRAPPDPWLAFGGEECAQAVRFWTHGLDIWHPGGTPKVRHDYEHHAKREKGQIWVHQPEEFARRHARAVERLSVLYGRTPGDLGVHGLGARRSLEDWCAWAAIDLHTVDGKFLADREWRQARGYEPI